MYAELFFAVGFSILFIKARNGSMLLISGINDEQWPASGMSEQIVKRLQQNNFKHYYSHIKLNGGHIAQLDHFKLVYD